MRIKQKENICGINCKLLVMGVFLFSILNTIQAQDTSRYSVKMAESVMKWRPNGYGNWDYVTGTVLKGIEEVWRVTGDQRYYNYIKTTVDNVVNSSGTISEYNMSDYNIDEIKEGCQLLLLYKQTGAEKYKKAADQLRAQLENHPRTNSGGFWHKKIYPWQMWLDGLYMGSPFYIEYSKLFDYPEDFADVVHQITEMDAHTYDPAKKLYYHGWDESNNQSWADPVTGASPSFWGRAVGWYAMAIVDVLDYLPQDDPGRDTVLQIFNRLAEGVVLYLDPDSLVWWQVTDQIQRDSNYIESSSSCMFVYALAKGVRLGYLDSSYKNAAINGYQGILDKFVTKNTDGTINLTMTCRTAGLGNGRDGSYSYYTITASHRSNDGKGIGPFMLASLEIEMLDSIYPPGNLWADSINLDAVFLSWNDNSYNENGFLIERKSNGDYIQIADLPAGTTTYADTSITSFTVYQYRVKAYNDTATSAYSNSIAVSVPDLSGLPGKATNPFPLHQSVSVPPDAVLTWTEGNLAGSHDIYFGVANPPPFVKNSSLPDYSPTGMINMQTYYWRIDEVNLIGTTEGDIWSFTTLPITTGNTFHIQNNGIEIFPNPAEDYLYISVSEGIKIVSVTMYDNLGRLVSDTNREDKTSVQNELTISTSGLMPGIYYVKIITDKITETNRIIIR